MALKRSRTITLTGIIIPTDWRDQEVVAVSLATPDEKEYGISQNRKGRELLAYLQHPIEAKGLLSKDEKGRDVITIRSYLVKQIER